MSEAASLTIQASKRIRDHRDVYQSSFPATPPVYTDRLQKIYPNAKDSDIALDERNHKYVVKGQDYLYSVSTWCKCFFNDFNSEETAAGIIRRHQQTPGFRTIYGSEANAMVPEAILKSSLYNLKQHICLLEEQSSEFFLHALRKTLNTAATEYRSRSGLIPFNVEQVLALGVELAKNNQKPVGQSCYYLVTVYNGKKPYEEQLSNLLQTWEIAGKIESLKGSFLHKKIELFINALGARVFDILKNRSCSRMNPVKKYIQSTFYVHAFHAITSQ